MRIQKHPILEFKRARKIKFVFDGKSLEAYSNETIASALYANRIKVLSFSPKYKRARGFFCAIGKCSSCLMTVNGIPNVKTCTTLVEEGMEVKRQARFGELPKARKFKATNKVLFTDVLVVGAGPAGLSAAINASRLAKVIILDENHCVGGQLIKQTHKFFGSEKEFASVRGIEIAKILGKELQTKRNIEIFLNTTAVGYYKKEGEALHLIAAVRNNEFLEIHAKKLIIATGAQENFLSFPGNDLPGVVGAGGVQTLMNVYGVKPGSNALMVGSGNVGLIVSYQMLQAGISVKAVVEALPKIGGYFVHAAKLRRFGVPILTSHTVKEVSGNGKVENATIVRLDENWNEVEGSEKEIKVDLVCLAVGLSPSSELPFQAGCENVYIPELGGWLARHNENLETGIKGIYVAGDCAGVEEASTAMLEGKIAGLHAGMVIAKTRKYNSEVYEAMKELERLRRGPFGERARKGKLRMG
ncbi:MAG: FAD-dependent oxidoreductase [Candidatus Thermoplasmatota archaeon]|nr:FAD-dependent oxidoreductase [Candidatus Thermoplasmatota archaeon]